VTLPHTGRKGDTPAWPLSDATERELALWEIEWRRPQAIKWEANGQQLEVALYVRSLVAAEAPDASSASRVLVLRQQEYLGLSVPGLARNKWKIDTPLPVQVAVAQTPVERRLPAKKGARSSDVRARMKVLNGGNGGA
jgi:hypothetical protein